MNIDELTLGQIKEIKNLLLGGHEPSQPYMIGKNMLIRTVTMILVGRVVEVEVGR